MGTRNITRRESALHSELEALRWAMENMLQHSTCQSFGTDLPQPVIQENNTEEPQVLSLGNICLLDGSWTSAAHFSGCGWVWMDSGGNIQLMGTRNITRRESALHSELEALRWAMENMLQHSTCQSFGTDCKDLIATIKEPHAWPSFATELERMETLQICLPDFSITHVPRARNQISDFLAKTARSFHRELFFIGCSISVWLPRPLLA
ncbi:hypothetical protein DY000_02038812 [Brassica cretica]|uniref:RNase H type-1 domain-containing protein n=1 Tax=Brassica cretica TaxID=69181 RepID=A0ABQ7BPR9_BRACR|nr:hypothetical protein DY000_02038812 [Brassica cretica]